MANTGGGQYPPQPVGYPQPPQPAGYPQPAQYVAPTTQVVYQNTTPPTKTWPNYKSQMSKGLGITQIVVAILVIIFNAVGIGVQADRTHTTVNGAFYAGSGFWGAIFLLLSGGFAIGAGRSKTSCMIIANMVLSILTALFSIGILSVGAIAVGIENSQICSWTEYSYICYDRSNSGAHRTSTAMGALMLLLSFVAIISAIWSSALACAAVCCGRSNRARTATENTTTTTTYVTGSVQPMTQPAQPYGGQQYPAQGQQGYPPAQQGYPQPPVYPQQQPGYPPPPQTYPTQAQHTQQPAGPGQAYNAPFNPEYQAQGYPAPGSAGPAQPVAPPTYEDSVNKQEKTNL